ncbi:class I SAM-dependent methyltransferase [Streptomyces sp. NPDC091377]|uniref:class I SAM-dependent methyltransferase n=1 Tax=Streptomyces sp. NPDC091377 TaxID=3365995 RepID=UPI003830F4C4
MTERAMSFGTVAQAYERYRPGYPEALADQVAAYAGRPIRTALEIGAGTGKATRLFARRGIAVTATEPDPAMLAELRRRVPDSVRAVRATFEEVRPRAPYDLVYAAASLHWTAPESRWSRVAALLEPGGVFASFGGPFRLADPALAEAVRTARAPCLETDEIPSPDGTPHDQDMQWPGTELLTSGWFTDIRQSRLERPLTLTAPDYLGQLSTVSAYLVLPPAVRDRAFRAIAAILPDTVEVSAHLTVHLARRREERQPPERPEP